MKPQVLQGPTADRWDEKATGCPYPSCTQTLIATGRVLGGTPG